MNINRRRILAAAGGTLAAAAMPGKPYAEGLPSLSAGLQHLDPPQALPEGVFVTADGAERRLSDFKGRGMVVNLWATWCVPCGAEMPSLQALSKALAPDDIAVLPLSSDRGGADAVRAWYGRHDITALPILLDPKGALAHGFGARGIPTTVIVDTAGQQVAKLEGAADWAAPEAAETIRKLIAA